MRDFSDNETMFFAALATAIIVMSIILVSLLLLSRPPAKYSELYFDLDSIKESATVGEEIPIIFFVENHELAKSDYQYVVSLGNDAMKRGEFSLNDGEKKQVAETIKLSNAGKSQKVLVSLQSGNTGRYDIFFWLDVSSEKQ